MLSVYVSVCLSTGEGSLYKTLAPAPRQVMFSVVFFSCVCLSVHGEEGGPCTGPRSPDMFKLVQLGPHCTGPPTPQHVQV